MAYTIQAFIGKLENLGALIAQEQAFVALEQGFVLVPANESFRMRHELELFVLLEGTDKDLAIISNIGVLASKDGKIAYIEAEFFGGDGMQAAIMFEYGSIVSGLEISRHAINLALQFLGVSKLSYFDEFDALGLGKHRDIADWPTISV